MDEQYGNQPEQAPYGPYGPPEPSRVEWMWMAIKYYSLPVAVVLIVVGLGAALYWMPESPTPTWSEEEIQAAIEAHQSSRQARSQPSNPTSAGSTAIAEEQSALGGGYGTVSVRSRPSDATVRVDGDSVGTTPLFAYPLKSGVYFVSIEKEGYFSTDTLLVLRANESPSFSARLRDQSGAGRSLSASRSSGSPRSGTAASTASESSQRRQVLPPQEPRSSSSDAAPERSGEQEGTLQTGTLEITTTPNNAQVLLNGERVGVTPLALDSVTAGAHQIVLYRSGYETVETRIEVSPGEQNRLERSLTRRRGQLRVLARPWGSIYIDGTLQERNADVWYETTLPAGSHQITVVHPALGRRTRVVAVSPGQTQSVVVDLREASSEEAHSDTTGQDGASEESDR